MAVTVNHSIFNHVGSTCCGCCTSDSEDCKSSAGSETEDEKLATSRLEVFIFDIFSVTSGNFCQIAAIGTVTAAVKRMTAKLENFESMFNATNKPGNDFEACEEQGVARKWKKETSADHTPLNINSITGSRKVKMLSHPTAVTMQFFDRTCSIDNSVEALY